VYDVDDVTMYDVDDVTMYDVDDVTVSFLLKLDSEACVYFWIATVRSSLLLLAALSMLECVLIRISHVGKKSALSLRSTHSTAWWLHVHVHVQVIFSLTPIWSAVIAHFLLGEESMGPWAWVGGVAVVLAGILASRQ
jgi:drug/metabolite transporter (DMT)-like permease